MSAIDAWSSVRSHVGHGITRLGESIAHVGDRIEGEGFWSVEASRALWEGHKAGYESARAEIHAATAARA